MFCNDCKAFYFLTKMTTEEKDYAKSLRWIIFSGDYALTEAMNCVIEKDWIRECDSAHIFEAPENQLTDIGKIVIKRLMFCAGFFGYRTHI